MKFFPFLFLLIGFNYAVARQTTTDLAFDKQQLHFTENKGQVKDQYGVSRSDLQYVMHAQGINVFIGAGHIYYQFAKPNNSFSNFAKINRNSAVQQNEPVTYEMYQVDMQLLSADTTVGGIASNVVPGHQNYYVNDRNGTPLVKLCDNITYKDIYPGIDWVLYIKDGKLEYDFIVNPGANINNIKIRFNGADSLSRIGEGVKIFTPLGTISQFAPYTFEKTTYKPLSSSIVIKNGVLLFQVPEADNHTIIIDPALEWGTYYGGTGRDVITSNSCDRDGNVFISGFTQSVSDIATTGTYQTNYTGYSDAFIAKFSSSGDLLWGTYFGGNNMTFGESITNDSFGNSLITGFTYSTNIGTPSAYQNYKPATGMTAFLAKFDHNGMLVWSTYYGLNGESHGRHVSCDADGCVYVTGNCTSDSGIVTPGCFQDTVTDSATSSSFLAKFGATGNIIWGSLFGGGVGYNCLTGKDNDIYLIGTTGSGYIPTTPGCYKDTGSGYTECYIAKFDTSCNLIWSTYYGGEGNDYTYGATIDDSSVYLTGLTGSLTGISTPGSFQPVYGGGLEGDAFLAKFSKNGIYKWGTYYGGSDADISCAAVYDGGNTVYIAGYTDSDNGIATPGSLRTTRAGIDDAFLAAFNKDGERIWSTYYGGELNDFGYAITCHQGNIYLAGETASSTGIGTENGFKPSYSDTLDGFLLKFNQWPESVTQTKNETEDIELYPNPNNGIFFVNHVPEGSTLRIFNIFGTSVATIKSVSNITPVSLPNLPPAAYIASIVSHENAKFIRFTIE